MEDMATCPPSRAEGKATLFDTAKEIGAKLRASLFRLDGKLTKVHDTLDEYQGKAIPPAVGGHLTKWVMGCKDHVDVLLSDDDLLYWVVIIIAPNTWPLVRLADNEETAHTLAAEFARAYWRTRFNSEIMPGDSVILVEAFFDDIDDPKAQYTLQIEEQEVTF